VVALSADLEKRGDAALDGMERVVKEHEKDIVALEGELKQMTNGPDAGNASGNAAGSSERMNARSRAVGAGILSAG
jgi:hypothetical protein